MSFRHTRDDRPKMFALRDNDVPRSTLSRFSQSASIKGNAHLFTDAKIDEERRADLERFGYNPTDPHFMLREIDNNRDVWDTITQDVVQMMLNPPQEYDPKYQKKVAVVLLTAIGALSRQADRN